MNTSTYELRTGFKVFLVIVSLLILIFISLEKVDVGERKLVVGFGVIKTTLGEGLHFVNPLYTVYTFNLRNNKYDTVADAGTSDIQKATISVTINYNIEDKDIAEIYTQYGVNFMDKVFAQNVQEAIKSTSAKFTATELITKRDDFKVMVKDSLVSKMPNNVLTITGVAISNVAYSDSFNQSVENKVKAEQDALTAKANLDQKKYEAEAIKIQAEAINNAGGEEYVRLKAIEKWNGVLPTTTGGVVPFIGIK